MPTCHTETNSPYLVCASISWQGENLIHSHGDTLDEVEFWLLIAISNVLRIDPDSLSTYHGPDHFDLDQVLEELCKITDCTITYKISLCRYRSVAYTGAFFDTSPSKK